MLKILLTATVQSHICQFHRPLVQMLRDHGDVEIHVAAYNNLAEKNGLKLDFADKVYDIPFSRSPKSPRNIKAFRQLKSLITKENYDIIHCNTPVGGVITRLAAKKTAKNGTKVFYTAHGFHFYNGASKKNWAVYYPIEKRMARFTDKLITINEEDYALAKSKFDCEVEHIHGVGVFSDRYHEISDDEKRIKKEKMGFSNDDRLILNVGELLPNKNHIMAVRAMKYVVEKYPRTMLLIAGNGPEEDNLRAEISSLGLGNNVHLIGYCTHLEDYQQICDCSVACSIREGLGLNVIESMLSGNPVVATKNRGHNELIKDGVNGFLINIDDDKAFADSIIRLLSDDRLLFEMSERCCDSVSQYTAESVSEELKAIYFDN